MRTDHARRLLGAFLVSLALSSRAGAIDGGSNNAVPYRTPAEIPVDVFFRPAALQAPKLNPAGTQVGMIVHDPQTDTHGLMIYSLADGKRSGLRGGGDYDVSTFSWAGDDRVVFSVARNHLYAWGLYALRVSDTRHIVTLNARDAVRVLGTPLARPDNLLVWIERSAENFGRPGGLLELDLRRDAFSDAGDADNNFRASIPLPPNNDGVLGWLLDRTGEVRYAATHREGVVRLSRRDDGDVWRPIALDPRSDAPLAVDHDAAVLFVAHLTASGTRELRRYDTRDNSLGPVLHADDKYDFGQGGVMFSASDRAMIGLSYARQAMTQIWFNQEDATLQAALDSALPAHHLNRIVSRSRDGRQLLIVSSSDRHPGALYWFDRPAQKLGQLAEFAPWLPEKLMAPVMLMSFKTRDGLQLDGYVTLPLDHAPNKPGPMVVVPHGGPWARDIWGYDALSQFLASRGYIVFRPNYRGSTGYNEQISLRPRMEFRRMHDDVTDGVRALVAAKIADPAHLAIFGSSFGGYLAMAGAAFEPDLYRCAVSFAGVFDWERALRDDRANDNDFRLAWLRRDLGDPKVNREKFDAISPYLHVAQIKCPVFIAHGEEDRNADTSQSRRLVKALAKAGVPHETMFVPDEGHGLAAQKHRTEFFTRLEAFLRRNL